ncbi:MAG: hypothetical protein U5J62_02065 [Desulfurivibrio sp.]|nr:hypothetical protein [Desulfurivibrio sp.]
MVLLTGFGTLEAAVAALKAGADDYLVKSVDYLELLPSTLNAALAYFQEWGVGSPTLRVLYGCGVSDELLAVQEHLREHAPHIDLDGVLGGEAVLDRLSLRGKTR